MIDGFRENGAEADFSAPHILSSHASRGMARGPARDLELARRAAKSTLTRLLRAYGSPSLSDALRKELKREIAAQRARVSRLRRLLEVHR